MKKIVRMVLVGEENIGKTQVFYGMTNLRFETKYKATIDADFKGIEKLGKLFQIWDTAGQEKYKMLIPSSCLKHIDIFFFCVDLTKPINEDFIKQENKRLKKHSPDGICFLVGTKSDLCINEDPNLKLANIEIEGIVFIDRIVTSAKDNVGIDELFTIPLLIINGSKETFPLLKLKEIVRKPVFQEARDKLLKSILQLPADKRTYIKDEIKTLLDNLNNPRVITPEVAIAQFSSACEDCLKGKYPNVLKAIGVVIATAVVTVLAGMLGFGIGFALGAWTGPGSFITGLLAGSAAAVTVATATGVLGLGTGGLASYGLFKKSSEENAVDVFVEEIKEELMISL